MINEVMYNPEPNDNYNEWIELYNPTNHPINISDWSITDNFSEDFIEGDSDHGNGTTIIPSHGYAIITDHGTKAYENYSIANNVIRLYIDDLSIGNGLGNSKDKIILKNKTGTIIDAIEWGEDYTDVPGAPANLVQENSSLARYDNIDTNNTNNDFFESTNPTPGSKNQHATEPKLEIETYPRYISKIENNSEYSIPFAIRVNISNYASNETYQLKTYLTRNISGRWPASQTWDEDTWTYSDRYTHSIHTDRNGNWTDWVYLRFKKDYVEYQNNIKRNNVAYINVKIKKEDNSTNEISKQIHLLDMDSSTSNGTIGGYIIGTAEDNNTFLENKIILVENKSNETTGIYLTENNEIDEGLISKPGYYKITSPVSSENTIKFIDEEGKEIHTIANVTVEQGKYKVSISSPDSFYFVKLHNTVDIPLTVENTGDFNDNITISVDQTSNNWEATLDQEKISLNPKSTKNVNLHVAPPEINEYITSSITISVTSEKDPGETDEITIDFEILGPDLTIKTIKIYDESKNQSAVFGHGEIIKIKAFLKNLGNENATDVNVKFYYDKTDMNHFIGSKNYELVSKYQKYPSVEWDTKDAAPGDHTIFVIVDEENNIDELDETNNQLSADIMIYNTHPTKNGRDIKITEVYYHTHTNVNNEYIAIYNPTNTTVDVSGWYLTNKPLKTIADQTKIVFPDNTTLSSETCLYITQNASTYSWETGKTADFEYLVDSDKNIPQMFAPKQFIMSNNGGMIALKDCYNHTIDLVVYGKEYDIGCWNGSSIPSSGSGVILKRSFDQYGLPVDTNTSNDWDHPRRYGIGQSDFPYVNIPFTGEIRTFVSPDCSFETITSELKKANESIYFNIYEFTNPFLCDELISALKRNVSVNIFLEGSPVGGIPDKEKYILNRIATYGGNIRLIVSDDENSVYNRYTFDHGKYLIIDNRTVIVESCNWAKTGIPKDTSYGNREWGIVVRSEDVAEYFLNVFFDDYNVNRCDSYSFDMMDFAVPSDFFMDETIPYGWYEPSFEPVTYKGNFSAIPVFSPDTSYKAICDMIDSAAESIYIQQLYIYKDWKGQISPFVEKLVNKAKQGVDIKVIMNYNPRYESSNEKCNLTKTYFEEHDIEVKFIYTNWSIFSNIHNKGMIVDNNSVLISSINWNENSVTRNREAGIIIENEEVAQYYAEVFFYDWNLSGSKRQNSGISGSIEQNKNTIYIGAIFTMTFALIARDWRKRKWT
jgi:phosphatidylserine/phosphatidylglycerophosphate/cardiolipin synthase-like enzyme